MAETAPGSDAPVAAPTCYRHPDRETWIRCARCDRPICPDCMQAASVGFQCPECVREGSRTQRQARTVFGGRVSSGAPVTMTLIGINVVVYLLELALGASFVQRFSLIPVAASQESLVGVAGGEWYRLLTAAFLHSPSSPLHILFNMYALYVLGPPIEAMLGRLRFLVLYLTAALAGSAASYVFLPPLGLSYGASGAIFGLFAAWIVVARQRGLNARPMWILLAINLVLGFALPGIDWRAHLGGLVAGAVVTASMVYAPRGRWRTMLQAVGPVVVLIVAAGVVAWHTTVLLSGSVGVPVLG